MGGDASRWLTYDEAATLLGLPPEALKRLAMSRGWPRRSDPTGGTKVAVPKALSPDEAEDGSEIDEDEEADLHQSGARSLIDHLELRLSQLTEELAEARTEIRGVRYEAESLRVDAGRAQVFAALVEAERARSTEIKAERDGLAAELAWRRRPWLGRLLDALLDRPATRRRPF